MCTRIAQFTLWNPLGFRLPICTLIIDLGLALRIGSNRLIPYLAQKSDPKRLGALAKWLYVV